MLIRRTTDIAPREITPRTHFEQRRELMAAFGLGSLAGIAALAGLVRPGVALGGARLSNIQPSTFSTTEKPNSFKEVTTYNNFVEFGFSDKRTPSEIAGRMKTRPWAVAIDGLVKHPRTIAIEDILRIAPLEERIYRLRCVETWSMVIPWVGFPLHKLLTQVEALGSAKFVEFWSLADPAVMPGVRIPYLDWPYVEGLRLDEAMHPLTIMAVGLYGEELPNQNGAPLRLVVPWKYGFKSAKSIVKIRFVDQQPATTWNRAQPDEYGFFANVNPEVDHPRWRQTKERRIGEFFKRSTQMFNGYADQVGQLYAGMDLHKFY